MILAEISEFFTQLLWPLVQFLIGLGVVVVVHEGGHFLAAKWAGIEVERFALGMGPRLFGVKIWGTDFCICALPLGGYVKMLGQEDFGAVEEADNLNEKSFNSAPVNKRLVVISAGVVMNIILAALLFILLCMVGKDFPAPVVGGTEAGFPAATAAIAWEGSAPPQADNPNTDDKTKWVGLQSGDKVISVNGDDIETFLDFKMIAAFAADGKQYPVIFERTIGEKTYRGKAIIGLKQQEEIGVQAFGISMPFSNIVAAPTGELIAKSPFTPGDKIVAVNGKPTQYFWDIAKLLKHTYQPAVFTVDRDGKSVDITIAPLIIGPTVTYFTKDGQSHEGWSAYDNPLKDGEVVEQINGGESKDIDVSAGQVAYRSKDGKITVYNRDEVTGGAGVSMLDILGMTPRLKVTAITKGGYFSSSPAVKAGLKVGDVVLSYGGKSNPTHQQFIDISSKLVKDGNAKTKIIVLRAGKTLTLDIAPEKDDGRAVNGVHLVPDMDAMVVGYVRENSLAAKAGLPADAEILAVNNQKIHSWIDLVETLKKCDGQELEITAKLGASEQTYKLGKLTKNNFDPEDYHASFFGVDTTFKQLTVDIVHRNPIAAIGWGVKQTYQQVLGVYLSLRGLVTGTVSTKAISGPVGIGSAAVRLARKSFMDLVYLMAILSTALAVFNFLPIPALDGGHAALMIIEKFRKKPLPLKLINTVQMIGFFLLIGLLLLVTFKDIMKLID
ncbi:MAG: site-2 protease family protein [Phycisphaerae bacterium]|nr:site-2 protease family protein [Phycisphaerae bacterium]